MAKVEIVEVKPPPKEVHITLSVEEAESLLTLLYGGSGGDTIRILGLADLHTKLHTVAQPKSGYRWKYFASLL